MSESESKDDDGYEVQIKPLGTTILLWRFNVVTAEGFFKSIEAAAKEHGRIFRFEFVNADMKTREIQIRLVPDNGMQKIRITDEQLGN